MRGGNISGCEVPGNSGGAIWVIGAEFTMNGGKISDCEADSGGAISVEGAGGAVYIYSDPSGNGRSVFTMSGGEISGNTAYTGGGVYVFSASPYYSTFTMSGGTISGNTAGLAGGGVYVENQNIFAKRGGTINANSPNEAYSVFGSKTRTTPAGPGVRLYVESDSMANTGNFVDPDGSVDTTSNWQ
jgi:hypothetical protein